MANSITFSVCVSGTVALTGASSSFSIEARNMSGSLVSPQPSITELGQGLYQFTVTDTQETNKTIVHIDCGEGREPRRYTFACYESNAINQFWAWHLENYDSSIWSGSSPSFVSYTSDSGTPKTPPTIFTITSGVFAATPSLTDITNDCSGKIISPSGSIPEFVVVQCQPNVYGASGPPSPPDITNFIPSTGSQITRNQVLQFDVTDFQGFTRILIQARYPTLGIQEVVHDGYQFGYHYSGSDNTFMTIIDGYRYTVLRDGGWPEAPILTPFAIDTEGSENL